MIVDIYIPKNVNEIPIRIATLQPKAHETKDN